MSLTLREAFRQPMDPHLPPYFHGVQAYGIDHAWNWQLRIGNLNFIVIKERTRARYQHRSRFRIDDSEKHKTTRPNADQFRRRLKKAMADEAARAQEHKPHE